MRDEASFFSDDNEPDNFSADWTLFRSGERGGSALFGREIWRTSGGEECSFTGKDCMRLQLAKLCPGRGEGERCGEVDCDVGDGVCAKGDSGIFPADFLRGERYWR